MPFLTKSTSVTKGAPLSMGLSKSTLAAFPKVANDSYFSDTSNWKAVSMSYKNNKGQEKIVVFDTSQSSPSDMFVSTAQARGNFEVKNITIFDFDGGVFTISRSELSSGERSSLDVNFGAALTAGPDMLLLSPDIDGTAISLMYTLVQDATYKIYRSTSPDITESDLIASPSTFTYSDMDGTLEYDVRYYYRVKSVVNGVESDFGPVANVKQVAPFGTQPSLVPDPTVLGKFTLSIPTVVGATAYDVEYGTDQSESYTEFLSNVGTGSIVIENVTGNGLWLRVVAKDETAGTSYQSGGIPQSVSSSSYSQEMYSDQVIVPQTVSEYVLHERNFINDSYDLANEFKEGFNHSSEGLTYAVVMADPFDPMNPQYSNSFYAASPINNVVETYQEGSNRYRIEVTYTSTNLPIWEVDFCGQAPQEYQGVVTNPDGSFTRTYFSHGDQYGQSTFSIFVHTDTNGPENLKIISYKIVDTEG